MIRKIINIISTVILILLVILVIVIITTRVSGKTPSLFGYRIYRVQTDSMVPTLEVGDVILVREIAPDKIENGDIITYRCQNGKLSGQTITHRVVQEPQCRSGVWFYQTQGDKKGSQRDEEIRYEQVEGKYIRTLNSMGQIYSFFLSPVGLITFISLIIVLFGYEIISLIMSYKHIDERDDDYYEPKPKKPSKKRKKPKKTHLKK